MARLIAIEWDTNEARVVIGRSRGKELSIEDVFGIPLQCEGQAADEDQIGPQLAAALSARGVGKADALVGVGRTSIELRRMQLPPAPAAELPDMVRLQAMRQFTTIGDEWPLDFMPLSSTPTSVEVLAAAISPQLVQQMTKACQACDLIPKRLVLRPFAAASLLIRSKAADKRVRLVVDVLASDADLFVLADDTVAFMRTVRLPALDAGDAVRASALLGEVRRTIGAAQSQLGGRRIEAIVVFGSEQRHRELLDLFRSHLELPLECLDPFELAGAASHSHSVPDSPGRFAPLLGMLLDEVRDGKHAIDFLSPRKRPEAKSSREKYLAYVAIAVAAACLLAILFKVQLNRKDKTIRDLASDVKAAKANVDAVKKRENHLTQVEQFAAGRIGWLDELHHMSLRFPDAKNAIVTQFVGSLQSDGEGRITINGMVRTPDQVEAMERGLRDDRHRVVGRDTSQDPSGKDYSWRFTESITVSRKADSPAETAKPETARPEAGTPQTPPPSPSDKTLTADRPNGSHS